MDRPEGMAGRSAFYIGPCPEPEEVGLCGCVYGPVGSEGRLCGDLELSRSHAGHLVRGIIMGYEG